MTAKEEFSSSRHLVELELTYLISLTSATIYAQSQIALAIISFDIATILSEGE